MARKDNPPETGENTPVPYTESGSVSPAFMDDMHKEAMAEAGLLPYLTSEEKELYVIAHTPLWILGARFAPSKFGGERAELSVTTDLTNDNKTAIFGGLADTPYWRSMVTKISATLDMSEAAGMPEPHNIGPVYAHKREYTNDFGPQVAYTFHANPQDANDAPRLEGMAEGDNTDGEEIPF